MSIVDFCVVGFPKCGTTATVSMLKGSPVLKVHYNGDEPEAPFFVPARNLTKPEPVPGKANGHKFTAYIYSNNRMRDLLAEKADALLLINVRPAGEAMLSWRDMHRDIARREGGGGTHFAASADKREFYANCTEAEYFEAYAKTRLVYAQSIRKFMRIAPKANLLVITQARLSRDARGVMREIHDRLGVSAPDSYYEALPSGHKPRGSRDLSERVDDPGVVAQLKAFDAELIALMSELDPARVLRAEPDGF
jgi:hypothetical protein